MSSATDEIWALFRETDRKLSASFQETERRFQETDRKFQETDRKFQETDRKFQETDRKFQETDRKFQEMSKETNRQFQETKQLLEFYSKLADKRAQDLDKKMGKLSNRLGDFVEEMVKPGVINLFQTRGIDVRRVMQNVQANDPSLGLATQIDLFVVNGDSCGLIEVKSHLSEDDVNEHVERMEKFKPLFPEYQNKRVFGAVAAMVLPEQVGRYAYKKGFFVLAQRGDTMVILNDDKFQPTFW